MPHTEAETENYRHVKKPPYSYYNVIESKTDCNVIEYVEYRPSNSIMHLRCPDCTVTVPLGSPPIKKRFVYQLSEKNKNYIIRGLGTSMSGFGKKFRMDTAEIAEVELLLQRKKPKYKRS